MKSPKDMADEIKIDILMKAHSAILLSLIDEVLREVVDQSDENTELWHHRLGHISEKGMPILSKQRIFG